jgi:hypothetical protein
LRFKRRRPFAAWRFPCVEPAVTLLVVAMLVIAACVAVPTYMARKYARRTGLDRELPPLIFPEMRRSPGDAAPIRVSEAARAATPPLPARAVPDKQPLPSTSDTVHFRRPTDEALQLLPGRLEVLSGLSLPREIRFVRIPGERPQLILGREPGSSPQDVALPSSTVSRQHARLDFSAGRWGVTNLSRTNPVVVNDETLSSGDGQRLLTDGDRIELGDVVLRFFAR